MNALFLSKLVLNPRSMAVVKDLGNVYEMHRTVSTAFPAVSGSKSYREEYHVLFRSEFQVKRDQVYLLVQSSMEPDWSAVRDKYPDYFMQPAKCIDISWLLPAIENGHVFRFKVKANPTMKKTEKKADNTSRSARIPLKTESTLVDWLIRKGGQGGFKPARVKITTSSPVYDIFIAPEGNRAGYPVRASGSTEVGKAQGDKMTFFGVVFEGYLVVTNASEFVKTLRIGIGSGKAFGYGLLSIQPERAGI